jgi:hypothetical protein
VEEKSPGFANFLIIGLCLSLGPAVIGIVQFVVLLHRLNKVLAAD